MGRETQGRGRQTVTLPNWAGPAVTKASWTRPTFGGVREALILWGAGEEQALGGARVERNWTEAAQRKVS